MNKKQRNSILQLVRLIVGFITLTILLLNRADIYYYILVFILPTISSIIMDQLLPVSIKKKKQKQPRKNQRIDNKAAHNQLRTDHEIVKMSLDEMPWREVERLCFLYYKSKGYKPELTKQGADGGIDLIYYHPQDGKTAVQIKHYIRSQKEISVSLIRELDGSKRNYGCVFSEFITTSTFTNPAVTQAPRGMNLRDIHWFNREIIPWMKKETQKRKLA
ncbi:restriction endonuclease [Peribacillus loiseleuriae]|uniref:restriction endonuclease n=1 Tax=Peribacillus loiseleuriae TaxID=1679170 RepID=UPI003816381F